MASSGFNPERDIPSLEGKVILLTGGTNGIGRETLVALAKKSPAHLFFTGRDQHRAQDVIQRITSDAPGVSTTFLVCDHSSLASVKAAAERFLTLSTRLDILICNAGVLGVSPSMSADDYEIHWAINYLSHVLLTNLLISTVHVQPGARVVTVASVAFRYNLPTQSPDGIAWDSLRSTMEEAGHARNSQSKLANILFSSELARRCPEITSLSVHPGVVETDLILGLPPADQKLVYESNDGKLLTPAQGAYNTLWAATAPAEQIRNGAYYEPIGKLGQLTELAASKVVAGKLWVWNDTALSAWK